MWASFSTWIALPWIRDLGEALTLPLAVAVIAGLAIIPGYLTAYLVATITLDRPRPITVPDTPEFWPNVTLIVAAFNEGLEIEETLRYAEASDYPGQLRMIVVDDGSTDETAEIVSAFAFEHDAVTLVRATHGGKAAALNLALHFTETKLIATIDADTLLVNAALSRLVARYMSSPEAVAAIAGEVVVRNSRATWLTRLQEWDYFLGIGSIKRSQGLWQTTLVAQGAFSVYEAQVVRDVGGWPDTIGEDITLTWAMLAANKAVAFEPTAVAMTVTPDSLKTFARQRSRWAYGMIEGLRMFGAPLIAKRNIASHAIAVNFMFPWIDLCYTFAFLPGLVLAAFGNFAIVGPITIAMVPLNLVLSVLMYRLQRGVFREMGLRVRRNPSGYLMYIFLFQPLMSPLAVLGYARNFFHLERRW